MLAGQQVEERIRVAITGVFANTMLNTMLLLYAGVMVSMHLGWLLGWCGWLFRNSTLPLIESAFFYSLNQIVGVK